MDATACVSHLCWILIFNGLLLQGAMERGFDFIITNVINGLVALQGFLDFQKYRTIVCLSVCCIYLLNEEDEGKA